MGLSLLLRWMRTGFLLLVVISMASCAAWEKQKKQDEEEAKGKPKTPTLAEPQTDPSFQAFLGRLRKAVANRDMPMIASMMVPDFGYRWDTPPAGDNVFRFWDENGVWPELNAVLNEPFVPKGPFMVAPSQFADNPETYSGYRAGIRFMNGGWRFVYFVPADPNAQSGPVAPPTGH